MKPIPRRSLLSGALLIPLAACSGSAASGDIKGIYENAQASASVEFLGDGKAAISLYGVGAEATYKVEGNKVTLMFEGDPTVLTINSDGSLSGPPETYFARLKKKAK